MERFWYTYGDKEIKKGESLMARPYDPNAKAHDPAWIASRNRQDRHLPAAQVSLRIPYAVHDRWRAAANAEGLTLKDWIVTRLDQVTS